VRIIFIDNLIELLAGIEQYWGSPTIVITDPVYLEGPWEMTWRKPYAADEYEFTGVDCRLPLRAPD